MEVILDKLEKGLPITDINGFACRDHDGQIIVNSRQQIIMDLDSLPFAEYDSLPMKKYTGVGTSSGCENRS